VSTNTQIGAAEKYHTLNTDPDSSHSFVLELTVGAQTVLEVGAATGYLSEAIAQRGSRVVSVEPDVDAARIAGGRGLDVRVGSVESAVQPGETFDCIVLADVIEHVLDADAFLTTVLRHLAPGGALVISIPNVAHYTNRWALMRGRFDYTKTGLLDYTHLRFYTRASLSELASRHNLEIVAERYSLGPQLSRPITNSVSWYRRRAARILPARLPGLFAFQFIWKLRRR
jgi:2-polyprenyl-3-methyl-5-hydroxy-6-metoxy-1,4-benzoquinol methylase